MKVIITGATGMVGKGVLYECFDHPDVESILVINRTPLGIHHEKMTEILHADFWDFSTIKEALKNYDACFFCLGISSAGMSEEKFSNVTYGITHALATVLKEASPNCVFNYVSGAGCDSTEKGRVMWARVKGRTENMIFNMGFKDAYALRPGAILPEKGIKSKTKLYQFTYNILWPFFPIMKKMKNITTTTKVGLAMINSVLKGCGQKHLENIDINRLALK